MMNAGLQVWATFVDVEGGVWITKENSHFSKQRAYQLLNSPGLLWIRLGPDSGAWEKSDVASWDWETVFRASSEKVPSSEVFAAISTGERHSLFLAENGQVYGCESNQNYQLGLTSLAFNANLILIPDLPPKRLLGAF